MKQLKIIIIICLGIIVIGHTQVWKNLSLPSMNVSKIILDTLNQRAILFGGGLGGNIWYDGV
jgi:hypothetical protein